MARISKKEDGKDIIMNRKGLVLLSGGLDSTLAASLLVEQGIELEAINFLTCFCTCTKKGCKNEAMKVSENLGIKLKIINVTKEYLEIVKNPKHGYGSNMNPCIDCRILIFKKAKDYMREIGASFIVTGEVLGQRPMSQRLDTIKLIEKEASLKGLVVRPLSGRLFEPSIAEKEGAIDRDMLLDVQGRSRKPQIDLARKMKITDYPCPAGGCLLTDPGFAKRAKDLLRHNTFTLENIQLLKIGRHFRLNSEAKLIVGRNKDENTKLLHMGMEGDIFFDVEDIPSPIALLRSNQITKKVLDVSCGIISRYADGGQERTKVLYWKHPDKTSNEIVTIPAARETLESIRI